MVKKFQPHGLRGNSDEPHFDITFIVNGVQWMYEQKLKDVDKYFGNRYWRKDERICPDDFRVLTSELGQTLTDEQVEAAYADLDLNGDGAIDT